MSAPVVVAIVDRPGSPTRRNASRSAWAYTVGATHMRWASVVSRASQSTAACWPVPGCVGVPAPASAASFTT